MLKENVYGDITVLVIVILSILYYASKQKKGWIPKLRRFAATEAILEGIERAVEENRPAVVNVGGFAGTFIGGTRAPLAVSALGLIKYVAKHSAKRGATFLNVAPSTQSIAVHGSVIQGAFAEAGQPGLFDPQKHTMFWGTAGIQNWNSLMVGTYEGFPEPSLVIHAGGEGGGSPYTHGVVALNDALHIGGTPRWHIMYAPALFCDYVWIGAEWYAATAFMSEDPESQSFVVSEDVLTFIAIALMLGTAIIASVGVTSILNLLRI